MPAPRTEVLKVAWPEALSVPVPKVFAPSLKVTVPVGVPAAEVTVAVKVTAWPKTEELTLAVTLVVVAVAARAALTVWVKVAEVLVVKLGSPP